MIVTMKMIKGTIVLKMSRMTRMMAIMIMAVTDLVSTGISHICNGITITLPIPTTIVAKH